MKNINEICECLNEIKEIMLEVEFEMNFLFTCGIDDIEFSMEKIGQYRQMTDEIFSEIDNLCEEDETGMLKKAVLPRTDRKDVCDEVERIFELRQDLNAVINRVKILQPQVVKRFQKEKEKMLEEIKKNNAGQSAKAAKYYNTINDDSNGYHIPPKGRKI